ncbi:hypothetical protein K1719_036791 [Acacia pycnantha]|nr:hypothetical protein K1719_036791 [Acacia pycnantha]
MEKEVLSEEGGMSKDNPLFDDSMGDSEGEDAERKCKISGSARTGTEEGTKEGAGTANENVDKSEGQEMAEKWRVVQRQRRPNKPKEKANDVANMQKVGSRFEVLARMEGSNEGIIGAQTDFNQVLVSPVWRPLEQSALRKTKGKGKGPRKNADTDSVMKIVEQAQMKFVQQQGKRVEKRTHEVSEEQSTEILRLTMGNDCDMHEGEKVVDIERAIEGWWGSCGPGLLRNMKTSFNGARPILVILADTRCQEYTRLQHLLSLGFDSISAIPSVGRSGGLVAVWNNSMISVSLIEKDCQFFHMSYLMPSKPRFLLTSIYALPHSDFRKILWDKLKALSAGISSPWVVWGDFNDIIASHERIGGGEGNSRRIRWFQDQADSSGLIDLGASGP